MRVARSRRLVAEGYALATVARVLKVSRQALYRTPTPRTPPQRRPPADAVEQAIVAEALANQTDGYRMICAFVRRKLGVPVNRKRVLRVMRERKLIQRRRPLERRKRPGFFRVERPRQLWQLDMSSVWVAEHGWTYLMAIIDCCTRETVGWSPELRCRADEALANQTDGYRMICAFVRRKLGVPVNRKRVLRVMRERKLIQRRRPLERRKRPGFFRVERPRQLWQLDMSSVWVAEHGWTYLMAIIDCCTRETVGWSPELRCRADEALANQTDGYRMICAFVRRKLGVPVNRKRVLRVMRERKLIQRRRPLERRKRPGFFRVERPRQLWQLDMSSVWVAEHGWTYLMAIIDCCTRETVGWSPELRCRADEALANQTDGYRMICAFVRRKLGVPVNRKRVLRVMRERKLIQRRRPLERRKRPGFFRVERPRQLWQLDMSSVWVAEHGWTYLMAIIDCCTRETVGWSPELRCRADEAIAVVEEAATLHGIRPGELVLGSDNGSAFTARRFRARLGELGIKHRRGGYRDPESQAFIESWFGKLKEREVWLNEYETLDQARRGIGGYLDRYHHRPHSRLNYRTPLEVRRTWEDLQGLQKHAA